MNHETTIEAAVAASAVTISKTATYGGSAVAVVSSFAANQILALGGFVVAVLGLLANIYFQWRRDRREERLAQQKGVADD